MMDVASLQTDAKRADTGASKMAKGFTRKGVSYK